MVFLQERYNFQHELCIHPCMGDCSNSGPLVYIVILVVKKYFPDLSSKQVEVNKMKSMKKIQHTIPPRRVSNFHEPDREFVN